MWLRGSGAYGKGAILKITPAGVETVVFVQRLLRLLHPSLE
jgi:hypothetical protein